MVKTRLTKKAILSLCSPSNAHLRLVNSAFSGFASLKTALFIQPYNNVGNPKVNWVANVVYCSGYGLFLDYVD